NVATPWREGTNLSMAPAVMDMQSGQLQDLWPQLDRWVTPAWLTNTQLVAATDDEGAGAMYVGGVDAPVPTRVTSQVDTWHTGACLDEARFYGPVVTDPRANTATRALVYAVTSGIAASPQLLKFDLNPTAPEIVDPVVVDTAA